MENLTGELDKIYGGAQSLEISPKTKYVIISDLHVGNRRSMDDFLKNSDLVMKMLAEHYLPGNYRLILNGDVEELYRYTYRTVRRRWDDLYAILARFRDKNRLWKTIGNHDYRLNFLGETEREFPVVEALKLKSRFGQLFVFHSHQVDTVFRRYNTFIGFILRYIANPLRIRNYEVPYNSRQRFIIEKRVLDYSCARKMISIIGHTHRPMFQSLSKVDDLRFKIEELCRHYPRTSGARKAEIARQVRQYAAELSLYQTRKYRKEGLHSSPYDLKALVPLLFNSGCCVGKTGITAIEINGEDISLVHWFDSRRRDKYLKSMPVVPGRLGHTPYYRMVLNQEPLSYIFSRIELLSC